MAFFTSSTTERTPDLQAAIDVIVDLGITAARAVLTTQTFSVGGVPRTKTQTRQHDDRVELSQLVEVLDRLAWWGEWGQTRTAIQMELFRRAKEAA